MRGGHAAQSVGEGPPRREGRASGLSARLRSRPQANAADLSFQGRAQRAGIRPEGADLGRVRPSPEAGRGSISLLPGGLQSQHQDALLPLRRPASPFVQHHGEVLEDARSRGRARGPELAHARVRPRRAEARGRGSRQAGRQHRLVPHRGLRHRDRQVVEAGSDRREGRSGAPRAGRREGGDDWPRRSDSPGLVPRPGRGGHRRGTEGPRRALRRAQEAAGDGQVRRRRGCHCRAARRQEDARCLEGRALPSGQGRGGRRGAVPGPVLATQLAARLR